MFWHKVAAAAAAAAVPALCVEIQGAENVAFGNTS
jgi:hypothetical protein